MRIGIRLAQATSAAAVIVGAALFSYAPAQAAMYDFSGLTLGGGIVNLDITTGTADGSSPSDGGFDITLVSGTVLGDPVTLLGTAAVPPAYNTSPDGEWYYDNVYYPNSTSKYGTVFDNPGLLLLDTTSGTDVNIFSPGFDLSAVYTLGQSPNQQQQDLFSTSSTLAAATPLPSTWTMFLAAFVGLGYFAFRGSKKSSVALPAV